MSKKNLKPNIKRARTYVYNCNYHIVFSTKYRRKVLTAEVEKYMKKVLQEIAEEKGFEIAMVEVGEHYSLN
jgi:putative transposase